MERGEIYSYIHLPKFISQHFAMKRASALKVATGKDDVA